VRVARLTAQALLTDPAGRVLLIRVHDDVALDASDPVVDYWITVGGGVEAGESFEAAIVREVFEETGHRIDQPGPCIWRRRRSVTDAAGVTRDSDEQYFWCALDSANLSVANLTSCERDVIREFRWWDLGDPELARTRIFPGGFVDAARELLQIGPPTEPVWLS
jgi:8-oxo-dGTP pyrophosphatase MutT (NUDIX family)